MKTVTGKRVTIYPDNGKKLFRKSDGSGPFNCVNLGYTFVDGKIKAETAYDFEEKACENNEVSNNG